MRGWFSHSTLSLSRGSHDVYCFPAAIVDVGSAWFKYDMRRLGEILAFPKAWYRRTIVRRMFLGDLSVQHQHDPAPPAGLGARDKNKTDFIKHRGIHQPSPATLCEQPCEST